MRNDATGASVIPFVVRDDSAHSDVLFQTSDTTWQAYNTYGGNSLYSCTVSCPPGSPQAYKAAFKVSYNRPFHSAADDQGRSWLMYAEYPMIRFMEANGYDVSYMSGLDVATRGPLLLNHKSYMSLGTMNTGRGERSNVEAARDAGVHLAFFSGNEAFWKTRWEASADGTNAQGRTLVAYKDTQHFNAPTDPVSWTGTWRDPRFGTAGGGGNPENALTGQFFLVNSGTTDITVPASFSKLRLWRNTAVAGLASGARRLWEPGWARSATNGIPTPTTGSGRRERSGCRNTAAPRRKSSRTTGLRTAGGKTATHNLTMYKAASGALVFAPAPCSGPGAWTGSPLAKPLTRTCSRPPSTFRRHGNPAGDHHHGLTPAQSSTDTAPPTSTITSPAVGATAEAPS